MRYQEIAGRVGERIDIDEAQAQCGLEEILRLLGRVLPDIDTKFLAREIPEIRPLFGTGEPEEMTLDAFISRLAYVMTLERSRAFEVAIEVCGALREVLSEEGYQHLIKDLDDEFSVLFMEREPQKELVTERVKAGSTLADGRPGSVHPVSESNIVQEDSVSATSAPKLGRELATATGMTQERLKHTLAEGKAGSSRPLSD